MEKQQIAIKKLGSIVVPIHKNLNLVSNNFGAQLQVEAMNLGFIFSKEALIALTCFSLVEISKIFKHLQQLVGADKVWKPFYPNFPEQVINMDEIELYFNAILHYWTCGQWRPEYDETPKLPTFENVKFKEIGLVDNDDFLNLFTDLLSANGSLTEYDKNILTYFISNFSEEQLIQYLPKNIPFKETLCQFVSDCFIAEYNQLANNCIKTTTDVLRIACYFSGGDISLATNTKFKLSNKERKFIVENLERVISEEDVARYEKTWAKLFYCLHINSFKIAQKSAIIAQLARDGKCKSFNSLIEKAILDKDYNKIESLLISRPGDFGRRLDHVLRVFDLNSGLAASFLKVAHKIDTRVLFQILNHFKYRDENAPRIVLPKGSISKAQIIPTPSVSISSYLSNYLHQGIEQTIGNKFKLLPKIGKVYIHTCLKKAPIQMSMRTASDGLKVLQRGTRLSLGEKNILRFFVHWIGNDIDLSACFLTKDLQYHSVISYYNLRNHSQNGSMSYQAVHSGDITYAPAPNGGCEFIDIDLNSVNDENIKYVAMDVRVFSGSSFKEQFANAGWMMRDDIAAKQGKIFDAKTVEQRIALNTSSKQCLVALFDIKKREMIWLDLNGQSNTLTGGNNVESNKANLQMLVEAAVNLKKPTLYDLFSLHAANRGQLIDNPEEADIVFDEKMIFQYEQVLSKYLI